MGFCTLRVLYLCLGYRKLVVNKLKQGRLYAGASGSTDAAVEALIAGTLNATGEANCNHHDHEHGEGHTCGHGKCH